MMRGLVDLVDATRNYPLTKQFYQRLSGFTRLSELFGLAGL